MWIPIRHWQLAGPQPPTGQHQSGSVQRARDEGEFFTGAVGWLRKKGEVFGVDKSREGKSYTPENELRCPLKRDELSIGNTSSNQPLIFRSHSSVFRGE